MSTDLQAFVPEVKKLNVRGLVIEIGPLTVRQIPVMLKAFSAFRGKAATDSGVQKDDWLVLFSEHTDKIVEAIAVATGQHPDWVYALYPDEVILLAEAIWEVNQDCFVHRVLPVLTRALGGAPQLPTSLGPGTHGMRALTLPSLRLDSCLSRMLR